MKNTAFASFLPVTNRKRPPTSSSRISPSRRSLYYACQSPESKPVRAESAPLSRRDAMPTLFRGPEAVLGIVIAAAALLVDFSRSVARLIARPQPALKNARDLDDSIALLSNALDASKAALADTENRLDDSLARASSAETALLGIGDTREAMRRARETTQDAEEELRRVSGLLSDQRKRLEQVSEERGKAAETREEFEKTIKQREEEVKRLRELVEQVKTSEEKAIASNKSREEELRAQLEKKEKELESVRADRLQAEQEATALETRATSVAEQAEAAEFALEETKRELERVQHDLDTRQKERELVDVERTRAAERLKETKKLRKMVTDMERELSELQSELRSRDQVVNEFAMEADELRSLLAARDAELRDVSTKLESAVSADAETGGDSKLSEMNLSEIQKNLDAEQLALSAEISKAELASFDLSERDLDPLDRIKKEMGAEGNLLQAGLRKAESAVRLEEHTDIRKDDAVGDVMKSISDEDVLEPQVVGMNEDVTSALEKRNIEQSSLERSEEAQVVSKARNDESGNSQGVVPVPLAENPQTLSDEVQEGAIGSASGTEAVVAKQAQLNKEEADTKPKRRRGRPRSVTAEKTASSESETETKPRRRRGRRSKKEIEDTS